jgi:1-acyl-sn-glycerol-3-phosphate acyltransferase
MYMEKSTKSTAQKEVESKIVKLVDKSDKTVGQSFRQSDVDRWGRSESTRQLTRKIFDPIYSKYFRTEWDGLEKIPAKGGALLVSNHAGAIPPDAPVIMHGIEKELNRPVYGLADFWFRTLPIGGTLWNRAGGVPAHPSNAYGILHDDQQLALVFPEGVKGPSKLYKDRYQLRRFGRGGFVEIAMRSGVPIIPIAVVGAEDAMPILTKFPSVSKALSLPYFPLTLNQVLLTPFVGPILASVAYLPAKFKVRVLDPIYFDVPPDQLRYSKTKVLDESENIRIRIQDAIYDMLAHRKNPWLG